MEGDRYFQLDYDEVYFIFDKFKLTREIDEDSPFEDFSDAMEGEEIVELLNQLTTDLQNLEDAVHNFFIENRDKLSEELIQTAHLELGVEFE